MPKARNAGDYTIKFMDVALNKEACSAEFFIEFDEKVWNTSLLQAFEKQGAGDVYIATFKHNDGNESAANALLRVWELAEKTGISATRGKCSDALMAKARAKQAEAKNKKKESEFDEKTQAAIKASMQNMEGKMDQVGDQIASIETGVCRTILDYQRENERLNAALAQRDAALVQKTLDCDRMEKRVADGTRLKNERDECRLRMWELESELKIVKQHNQALQALQTVQTALDAVKWIMTDERVMKRPRTDSDE